MKNKLAVLPTTADPPALCEGVADTIRSLRNYLGDSQQAFATRLGLSISAIANYEATIPRRLPEPKSLAALALLARSYGQPLVECIFLQELARQLGVPEIVIKEKATRPAKGKEGA